MKKNINNMTIFSIAFLIVFSSGLSGAGQSDIPEPDVLQGNLNIRIHRDITGEMWY